MKFRAAWCVALVAVAMGTASCSHTSESAGPIHELRVGAATAVLRESASGLSYLRNALSLETLVTISEEGRAEPRVLESWSYDPGLMTWRMKVRSGVRFHDGTEVTATELVPQVRVHLRNVSLGAVESVDAESPSVLVIKLREPYAFLLEDMASLGAQRTVDGKVFGTGAYVAVEQSNESLTLQAVRDHYRGRPAVERIEVSLFPDQRNAWSALMRNQLDMLYEVSRDSLEFVRGESGIRVASFPRPYVYLLGFNVKHPSLVRTDIRRALDLAIDREEIVRVAMSGEGEAATGHIWSRHWAYDQAADSAVHDPALALSLLKNSGLEVRYEPGAMPARLRLRCLVYEPLGDLALVLQRQLANVDVDLQIEIASAAQLIEKLATGDFESYLFEMTSLRGLKFPYQFWHSGSPFLKHGYSGADAILNEMRRATDDETLRAAAVAFQRRLHEDPPAIFLAWGRTSRAVSNRFEIPEGDDDIYHTIARWKPAAKAAN